MKAIQALALLALVGSLQVASATTNNASSCTASPNASLNATTNAASLDQKINDATGDTGNVPTASDTGTSS
jgi:hypothetical protein